jgi:hypothetical protein
MSIGAIIPVKNESGNVKSMVIDSGKIEELSQIIFIDGNSTDGTLKNLLESIKIYGNDRMQVMAQTAPYNKFEALKQAEKNLITDHVIIWDGDNTIPLDDITNLIKSYMFETKTKGVFVMANRLTRNRDRYSIKFLNLLGNYFFSVLMKPILGTRIKDVLSGAKIFPRYLLSEDCKITSELDEFGDLTLLSRGKKNELTFISIPCFYKSRTYGVSSISRWKDGYGMFRTVKHMYRHKCHKTL